tara:strand:+ start:18607 stop:19497 length:891 start_codon:yes stop_codon:yes gene_type:complete
MDELKTQLEERRKMVDEKATKYRTLRDECNDNSKSFTAKRNEMNGEVRELIVQVREQREIREQMNEIVREKKNARQEANKLVREAKDLLNASKGPEAVPVQQEGGRRGRRDRPDTVHSLSRELMRLENEFEMGRHTGKNETKVMKRMKEIAAKIKKMKSTEDSNTDLKEAREKLRVAMEMQESAHEEVTEAAQAAQEAHDLMLQWNKEVDNQREKAESSHRELRKSKKEADKNHRAYIVSLRCLHSIQDMLRAMRGADSGKGQRTNARVEVQDLMGKLMSGETLSTEELMQLQRYD